MQLWRAFDDIELPAGGSSVALGVFDGVHRGHRELLATAVGVAGRLDLTPVLVTFDPHPVAVVRPGAHPALLTSVERRAELAAAYGIEAVMALPFDAEIASWEPREFVDRVLLSALRARSVSIGANFTFGRRAAGTAATMQEICDSRGIGCHVLDLLDRGGEPVSSTRVRRLLEGGAVEDAAELLGRPHRVSGPVIHGAGRGGRELGYPTANLDLAPHTAVPADGVYAGWFTVLDDGPIEGSIRPGVAYPCAVSVGTNPTFGGTARSVEAFVLDENADLYGRCAAVDVVGHVRAMEKFDTVDELLVAMAADVERTREILGIG